MSVSDETISSSVRVLSVGSQHWGYAFSIIFDYLQAYVCFGRCMQSMLRYCTPYAFRYSMQSQKEEAGKV